jgi:hypothetical protein
MKNYLHEDTIIQQSRLANYCRTGILGEINGLTENRVFNYRRLVYNVVDDTLRTAFPLTHNLLSEEEWDDTVNRFFSDHSCLSPSIWKMPYEFYQYFEQNDSGLKSVYPFLTELLLFEWMEIELYMMEDKIFPETQNEGSFENDTIKFNPEFKLMRFNYPVHQKNPKAINEADRGEYFLLMFRNKISSAIEFINLSIYYAWLIERINTSTDSLTTILTEAAAIFGFDNQSLLENTLSFLTELKEKTFVIGFAK